MSHDLAPIDPKKLEKTPPDYVQVNVRGETPVIWQQLRGTLMISIQQLLAGLGDFAESGKIREEAKNISLAALDYAKAKLEKPGLENAKIEAEIREKYAEIGKKHAETRITAATADKAEFENTVRKLKLSLGAAKVLLIGQEGDEAALFSLQIEEFLRIVKDMEFTKAELSPKA